MNTKPHRTNSDFQLLHFIAGDCHTVDGAWSALYCQKIDMQTKLNNVEVQRLRREAKIASANLLLSSDCTEAARLNAQADILEANADLEVWKLNVEAAEKELKTIHILMERLEPYRKYKDLPILEATEAAQQEEWRLEMIARAENHIAAHGGIPADELRFMRHHPDFKESIAPHVAKLMATRQKATPSDVMDLLSSENDHILKLTKE